MANDSIKQERALYMRRYTAEIETLGCRVKRLAKRATKLQLWREKVLEALGNQCKKCGFADKRALQIDHVYGGGQEDRRRRGFNNGYSYRFLEQILSEPDFLANYQLLCANCNWIKKYENRESNKGVGSVPRKYLN